MRRSCSAAPAVCSIVLRSSTPPPIAKFTIPSSNASRIPSGQAQKSVVRPQLLVCERKCSLDGPARRSNTSKIGIPCQSANREGSALERPTRVSKAEPAPRMGRQHARVEWADRIARRRGRDVIIVLRRVGPPYNYRMVRGYASFRRHYQFLVPPMRD